MMMSSENPHNWKIEKTTHGCGSVSYKLIGADDWNEQYYRRNDWAFYDESPQEKLKRWRDRWDKDQLYKIIVSREIIE